MLFVYYALSFVHNIIVIWFASFFLNLGFSYYVQVRSMLFLFYLISSFKFL